MQTLMVQSEKDRKLMVTQLDALTPNQLEYKHIGNIIAP